MIQWCVRLQKQQRRVLLLLAHARPVQSRVQSPRWLPFISMELLSQKFNFFSLSGVKMHFCFLSFLRFFPSCATLPFVGSVNIAASSMLEPGLSELPQISANFERSPQLLRGASEGGTITGQVYCRGDACWRLGHQLGALRLMRARVALTVSLRSVS